MPFMIGKTNDCSHISDHRIDLKCPHCGKFSHVTAVSIPRFEILARFRPNKVVIGYRCDACNEPICLRFPVLGFRLRDGRIDLGTDFEEIERPSETFEFSFLPPAVRADFQEALLCFSVGAHNAFAAMCRRTIQSACSDFGAKGKDKVTRQIDELKEDSGLEADDHEILRRIIIDGHDGAHPHLPKVCQARAAVLLGLMKDVLYQLYVRRGKLAEAARLRREAIADGSDKKDESAS